MSENPSIINPISLPTTVQCLRKISIVNPAVAIFTKDETINRIMKNYGNDLETKLNEIQSLLPLQKIDRITEKLFLRRMGLVIMLWYSTRFMAFLK